MNELYFNHPLRKVYSLYLIDDKYFISKFPFDRYAKGLYATNMDITRLFSYASCIYGKRYLIYTSKGIKDIADTKEHGSSIIFKYRSHNDYVKKYNR